MQRHTHALQLGLELCRQRVRCGAEAVGALLQLQELVRAPAPVPLHPGEARADEEQQHDQDLGRAPEVRRLARYFGRNAHAGALAWSGGARRGRRARGRHHVPRRGHTLRQRFRGRGRVLVALDNLEFQRGTIRTETDDVAAFQDRIAADARAVDERAVAAHQILQHKAFRLAHDRGMARGDVEIALRIKPHIRERMTAKPDVALAEGFALSRAGARQEFELGFH